MNTSIKLIIAITIISLSISCKKDNVDPPSILLTATLVYNKDSIGVEMNQVPYQIYQYGFGKVGPISGTFDQSGKFSQLLYPGNYKLIIPNGQGPFMWKQTAAGNPDTVEINLTSSTQINLDVTPYYLITSPQITNAGGVISAKFGAQKIITDANAKDIEEADLYINNSMFVSQQDNIASSSGAVTDMNNISLSVTVPTLVPNQNYVFARVGLKIAGVEDMILSPVVKIAL